MMVLNVGRFAGSGVGNVLERPIVFCGRRVPKRPTRLRPHSLLSLRLRANRSCQRLQERRL